jgi:hypothetical protein
MSPGLSLYLDVIRFLASLGAATPLTTSGGSNFPVPDGDVGTLIGLSNTVGAGTLTNVTTRASVGAAFDLSKNFITTVTVPLSTVTAL